MKEFILSLGVIIFSILIFTCVLILMLIFFIPVLPIMILAFPMTVMNQGTNKVHWSQKPYLWYFNKVWLPSLDELML
jgi:CHASE2 domain-containing sensor protein